MFSKKYRNIKVLCVENEELIRENQIDYLKHFYNTILEASHAKEALEIIEKQKPQLVITDIEMSDMNGLEMIRQIRKRDKKIKIIVLSAFSKKEYLLDAIDLGLVKYLIKPIDHETFYPILLQCAKEIIEEESPLLELSNDCIFDTKTSQIRLNDKNYTLSKYEADFLMLLYNQKPNVVTYEQIQYKVWINNIMTDNSLRTLVKSLRKKLPKDIITNLSKVGYKMEEIP